MLQVANEARFADLPPARIVPMLAHEGTYLASESNFARILLEHGQAQHRGRAKTPRKARPPTTYVATAQRQVWCWDMTFLPTMIAGQWFYLYLILDLYSRKIVGWCRREPKIPRIRESKIPHLGYASASSVRTRPAFNFSFSRYELPRMSSVTARCSSRFTMAVAITRSPNTSLGPLQWLQDMRKETRIRRCVPPPRRRSHANSLLDPRYLPRGRLIVANSA